MRKIPTLFERDESRRFVTPVVTEGCEWVVRGQGRATRKWDGTCVRFKDGDWWFRREVKPGKDLPPYFSLEEFDPFTGKSFGWEPARPTSGFIVPLREAIDGCFDVGSEIPEGTYELIGPKINGNPEDKAVHHLEPHGLDSIDPRPPLTFSGLRDWMQRTPYEGIVWHHPDGRMVKLKKCDFPKADR